MQYYFNRTSQETVWEEPEGWATRGAGAGAAGAAGGAGAGAGHGGAGGDGGGEEGEGFTGEVGALSDWEQFSDDEGDPYWHNNALDASSWFPPPGWAEHLAKRGGGG